MDDSLRALVSVLPGPLLVIVAIIAVNRVSPSYRAQKQRLGSAREVRRFRRAWAKCTVPDGMDRQLWLDELDHWPDPEAHERTMRRWQIGLVVLVLAVLAFAVMTTGGDVRAMVASVLPLIVFFSLFVMLLRFMPDQRTMLIRRTERLREQLADHPAGGGA